MIVKCGNERGPFLTNTSRTRNGQSGNESTITFMGTHDECAGFIATQVASGFVEILNWDQDGPVSTVTLRSSLAQDGSADQAFDTWELLGNEEQVTIQKSRRVVALKPEEVAEVIAQVAAAESDGSDSFSNFSQTQAISNVQFSLFYHLLGGHTSFELSRYVLRKTTAVSSKGVIKASFANVLKVYTSAQLDQSEAIPGNILFSIAEVEASVPVATFSADYNDPNNAGVSYFRRGWLKKTPTVQQSQGFNKFNIVQEFWFGYWTTFADYDAAS